MKTVQKLVHKALHYSTPLKADQGKQTS